MRVSGRRLRVDNVHPLLRVLSPTALLDNFKDMGRGVHQRRFGSPGRCAIQQGNLASHRARTERQRATVASQQGRHHIAAPAPWAQGMNEKHGGAAAFVEDATIPGCTMMMQRQLHGRRAPRSGEETKFWWVDRRRWRMGPRGVSRLTGVCGRSRWHRRMTSSRRSQR